MPFGSRSRKASIRVHRAGASAVFPARVQLVAAMNPCPCGKALVPGPVSTVRQPIALAGFRRLSSPMLDRLDIRLVVHRADPGEVLSRKPGESTASVLPRVLEARRRAEARGVVSNAAIPGARLDELAPLHPAATRRLDESMRSGKLSARGLHRVRRLALTVADLAGDEPSAHREPREPSAGHARRTVRRGGGVTAAPPAAYLAALGGLPAMGPKRLRALLDGRTPERAWSLVREGRAAVGSCA